MAGSDSECPLCLGMVCSAHYWFADIMRQRSWRLSNVEHENWRCGGIPPSLVVYWNHRVSGKFDFNPRAAMRCGQNIQNIGLRASGKAFTTEAQSHGEQILLFFLFSSVAPCLGGEREVLANAFARPAPRCHSGSEPLFLHLVFKDLADRFERRVLNPEASASDHSHSSQNRA